MEKALKTYFLPLLCLILVLGGGVFLGAENFNFKEMMSSGVAELRFYRMLSALFIGGALSLSGMVFRRYSGILLLNPIPSVFPPGRELAPPPVLLPDSMH